MAECLEPCGAKVRGILRKEAGLELGSWAAKAVLGAPGRPLTLSASEGGEGGRGGRMLLHQEASAWGLSEPGTSSAASPSGLVPAELWERGYFRCVKSDECWKVPSAALGTHSSYWQLRCARPWKTLNPRGKWQVFRAGSCCSPSQVQAAARWALQGPGSANQRRCGCNTRGLSRLVAALGLRARAERGPRPEAGGSWR